MEDHIRTAHGGMGALVRPQVTLDEANLEPFEALASARGEVVEDADAVTLCQEPADQVMADESSASCDERLHLRLTHHG